MADLARRALLTSAALAGLSFTAAADDPLRGGLADLERRHGGRLGVAVLDTATMSLTAQRGDERFLLCSTYKCLAAAFVLARVDRKQENLGRRIGYAKDDLVAYSPVTERHVGESGLTVGELCDAAVTVGDNTAGNLLFDSFGGPSALTDYVRSLGDSVTRFDRRETALNETSPGDMRDTTTPVAMLGLLHQTVLGGALSASSREQLTEWMVATTTGDKRLRAGVPHGWRVGDKTGSGANNAANDVAVIWPPARAPLVVVAFYAEGRASEDERNAILSEVGRLATT